MDEFIGFTGKSHGFREINKEVNFLTICRVFAMFFLEYSTNFHGDFCVFDDSGTYNYWRLYDLDPKLNLTLTGHLRKVPILYKIIKKNSASSA